MIIAWKKIRIRLKNQVVLFFTSARLNFSSLCFMLRIFPVAFLHGSVMDTSQLPDIHLSCVAQFYPIIISFLLGQHEITPFFSWCLDPSLVSDFSITQILSYNNWSYKHSNNRNGTSRNKQDNGHMQDYRNRKQIRSSLEKLTTLIFQAEAQL